MNIIIQSVKYKQNHETYELNYINLHVEHFTEKKFAGFQLIDYSNATVL
jgi:hypothetical protein